MLTNSCKPSMAGYMLEYQLLNDPFVIALRVGLAQRSILIVRDSLLHVFVRYIVL